MSDEQVKVEVVDNNQTPKKKKPSFFNNKNKSKARKIVEWILFGLFGVLFVFVMAGNIDGLVHQKENHKQMIRFGYGSFVIITNSMEPEIKKGDAIITYKENVKTFESRLAKGEKLDLTFMNEVPRVNYNPVTPEYHDIDPTYPEFKAVITHRLVEIHVDESVAYGEGRYTMVVAGINSNGEYSKATQYQIYTEKQYLGTVKVSNAALGAVFQFMTSVWGLIILLLVPAGYLIVVSTIDIFKTLKEAEQKEIEEQKNNPVDARLAGLSEEEKARLKKELLAEMVKAKREEKEKKNEKE